MSDSLEIGMGTACRCNLQTVQGSLVEDDRESELQRSGGGGKCGKEFSKKAFYIQLGKL